MKKIFGVIISIVLISLSGQVLAEEEISAGIVVRSALTVLSDQATEHEEIDKEELMVGEKIYARAFGRGCGACHDIASNPQLAELIKEGKLDLASFSTTIINGKNGMPKSVAAIMAIGPVKKAGYTIDQAIAAVYKFLSQ